MQDAQIVEVRTSIANRARQVPAGSPEAASVQAAEAAVVDLGREYGQELIGELSKLAQLVERLESRPLNKRQPMVEEIKAAAIDIMGLAGSFKFTLVAAVADNLRHFLSEYALQVDQEIAIVHQHLGLIKLALERDITDPNSPGGKQMLANLKALNDAAHGG
jgi:hypothetical protein